MEQHDHARRFWVVPADDPTDRYAAGYSGNGFPTREAAEAAIPALRELGPDWDCDWVVIDDGGASRAELEALDWRTFARDRGQIVTYSYALTSGDDRIFRRRFDGADRSVSYDVRPLTDAERHEADRFGAPLALDRCAPWTALTPADDERNLP